MNEMMNANKYKHKADDVTCERLDEIGTNNRRTNTKI